MRIRLFGRCFFIGLLTGLVWRVFFFFADEDPDIDLVLVLEPALGFFLAAFVLLVPGAAFRDDFLEADLEDLRDAEAAGFSPCFCQEGPEKLCT